MAFTWTTSHSDLRSSFTGKWADLVIQMQGGKSVQASTAGVEIPVGKKNPQAWKYLHSLKSCRHERFFRSAIVKHSLLKPSCLSNLVEKEAMIHKLLLLRALRRLWNSSGCHGRLKDVPLGLPQFCHLSFIGVTTSVMFREQVKEQNPGTAWLGLLWSYILT